MYRDTEGRPPITPQLAIRVAIIGGVALVMFGVIFFRLWYLQVLSSDKYRAEANNNQVREINVQAPRGRVVDRNGQVLVDNRSGYAVEADPSKFPTDTAGQNQVYQRLGSALGMRPSDIKHTVRKQFKALPFGRATIKADVPAPVYSYILENQTSFPGITVEQVFLRLYPRRQVGAQLFGTVSQINPDELKLKAFRGVPQGDRVGQSGIESAYDNYLRGVDGASRVQVDAAGTLRGELAVRPPKAGRQLKLTLDQNIEQIGQNALGGQQGAFVAMDVGTGAIRAMGSSPSFDPNGSSKGYTDQQYKQLTDPNNGAPLLNRAVQGEYVTGSTFKLITSVAALQSGLITPDTPINDPGSLTVGNIVFHNSGNAVNGTIALSQALKVSSDVFFYTLGRDLNGHGDGQDLQRYAAKFGLGHLTGVDLPEEYKGLVPSPQWRNRLYKKGLTDRPWTVGDNVNLAIGQGDLAVTPLQLATAYAALGNGGTVVRPHLGLDVEDSLGRVQQELRPRPARHIQIDGGNRDAILLGLHMAAQEQGGTSYPVFKDFPIPVAGKTGTAQHGDGRADQSWYVVLGPYPNPRYVVAVTLEYGGFGVETAAPAAKKILAGLLNVHLSAAQAQNVAAPAGVNAFG